MNSATHSGTTELTSCGRPIPMDDTHFGWLSDSSSLMGQPIALRERFEQDGYLFLRGFFEEELVLAARRELVRRLEAGGMLQPGTDPMDAIVASGKKNNFQPDLAKDNPKIDAVVYNSKVFDFYDSFFGEKSLAFSFKWMRAIGPGKGTNPHCDWVYMSRGSARLMTAWIPYGEVSLDLGGLIILEGSPKKADRIAQYLKHDVDEFCENRPLHVKKVAEQGGWSHPGYLSKNPATLQQSLGGRWLTAEFRPGDLLTFKMTMVHASLDNHTDRIRLSTDTRYQPASEPADERWIGENPVGHSTAGKRGRIC